MSSRQHRGIATGSSGGYHHRPISNSRSNKLPAAPPPPHLNKNSTSSGRPTSDRHFSGRHKSRSPIPVPIRKRPATATRYDEPNRGTGSSRRSPSPRLASSSSRRSPSPFAGGRKSDSKTKPPVDSHGPSVGYTSKSSRPDPHSIGRISSKTETIIIRDILSPEKVKIPRRVGEGGKPIFEREELRAGIERRMKLRDNDENPVIEPIEQRVVAIIREPVLIDHYGSSSRKHGGQTDSGRGPADRRTTSSGVTYCMKQTSPALHPALYSGRRSLSEENLAHERDQFQLERKRDRGGRFGEAVDQPKGAYNSAIRHENRSRSRSRSPSDRVRRVNLSNRPTTPLLPLVSGEIMHQQRSTFRGRVDRDRDLRESLNRPPGKFQVPERHEREVVEVNNNFRGGRGFNRGFRGGRGGTFASRPRAVFGRRLEPRWQHDKYDRDREVQEPSDSL